MRDDDEKKDRFVQGLISPNSKRRFNVHPFYRGRTQREFCGAIIEDWLDSPKARIMELEQQLMMLQRRTDWMPKQLERIASLEARVRDLEARAKADGPSSGALPVSA